MNSQRDAFRGAAGGLYIRYCKRSFDILFALLIIPVVAPCIGILYVVTRLDGGKGFFSHKRVGFNGKSFRCWKIRTMVPNAEAKLEAYLAANPEAAEEWARDHKLTKDPRITRFGKFLRRTSLDELPQIWNVLKGDMSFVGPRPVVRAELQRYASHRTAYLAMKPGITGRWQVSGRNDVSYDERVQMDVDYLYTSSFLEDARIILKTAQSVLSRTGK
ncbi:MAG: sugar transferase [Marinovum sp.]|nr:sugar transferase [Marinovum sp.]